MRFRFSFSYNFERLSNYLLRVERLIDLDAPIKEGYFSKLDFSVASRTYPFRVEDQKLQNVRREPDQLIVDIKDLKRWRDRIYEAIHTGAVIGVRIFVFSVIPTCYNLIQFLSRNQQQK